MASDQAAIDRLLSRLWYSKHPATLLLWPVSALVCLLVRLRRVMFRRGFLVSQRVSCPVVIVGNLSVGGTGKTPIVIWLATALKSRGIAVGIICGGYGGRDTAQPLLVRADSSPQSVGDEALLLARQTGAPVAAGRDRSAAAAMLATSVGCDLILSDDGLQHLRLGRDFEIVVIDGTRGFGNGMCLPVGPLREPVSRLASVDAVLINDPIDGQGELKLPVAAAMHCRMSLVAARELASSRTVPVGDFRGRRVHAVAAIGNPERFFVSLRAAGIDVLGHPHRDHAMLQPGDFEFDDDLPVLTTAKDAVRYPGTPPPGIWEVTAAFQFVDDAGDRLVEQVARLLEDDNAVQ